MKKSIKLIFLFFITINLICISDALAQQLPKPGSVEWKKLPIELRRESCKIPDTELASLSTEELLQRCLDYQFMSDILFTYEFKGGLDAMVQSFNGLRELFKRNDAAVAIINYYKKLNPGQIELIKTSIDKGAFIYKFVFLELYLTQPSILNQLHGKEKIIIKEVLEKFNMCIQVNSTEDKYVYSMFPLNVKGLLIAVLLNNMNDNSVRDLKTSYPEYQNVIENLSISNISAGLLSDLLKRASEL
jgi:hypothetical protein